MAEIARAEFIARCENNYQRAIDILDDAIAKDTNSFYPEMSKAYLSAKNKDVEGLRFSINNLKRLSKYRAFSEDTITRLECYLLVIEGNLDKAVSFANQNLKRCPDESRLSFIQRLQHINNQSNAQPYEGVKSSI
jgi:hypothetical protein